MPPPDRATMDVVSSALTLPYALLSGGMVKPGADGRRRAQGILLEILD
jgi:hypothetical protein